MYLNLNKRKYLRRGVLRIAAARSASLSYSGFRKTVVDSLFPNDCPPYSIFFLCGRSIRSPSIPVNVRRWVWCVVLIMATGGCGQPFLIPMANCTVQGRIRIELWVSCGPWCSATGQTIKPEHVIPVPERRVCHWFCCPLRYNLLHTCNTAIYRT